MDLNTVMKRFIVDKQNQSKEKVAPIKITRSVGLQVSSYILPYRESRKEWPRHRVPNCTLTFQISTRGETLIFIASWIMKIIPQNVHNNMFNLLYKEDNSEIPALSKSYHGERQYFNFPKTNCTICWYCTLLQYSVLQYQHILSKMFSWEC